VAILDAIKELAGRITEGESALLRLYSQYAELVDEALATNRTNMVGISLYCEEPGGTTSARYRAELVRRASARKQPAKRGGARRRPARKADPSDTQLVTSSEIARMAGVSRASVANWKNRYADFPNPDPGVDSSAKLYRRPEVRDWLIANGKIAG